MTKALATKNVAALLLAISMVFGLAFAFATPAKADTLSSLQAQVQTLLAEIAALQGSSSTTTTTGTSTSNGCYTFTTNLRMGSRGTEVMWLQKFLNNHGFTVADRGAGSAGNESSYFGGLTKAAVIKFQDAYASDILTPVGLSRGNGNWFKMSRAKANALCTSSTNTTTTTTTTTTGTTTTATSGGVTIAAATEPANSLAPVNANRVPFTTFTLTNNSSAAVTINGVTVQRTGLAADNVFAGVVLLDQNGLQLGTARTFDSNHQAVIGTPITLNPGQSETFTVAGNMETSAGGYAGQVASIAVVGVNTTATVSGSLPITGAMQTINESLTIGGGSVQRSSYDPLSSRSEPLGTTGLIFSGVRITNTGSAEDEKLYSITWNQTGSIGSTDLSNLVTKVNGTSYPVTVDSSGKYYTASFPGGITIAKGNSLDIYIQGDITGSDASGRTVEFDIYRPSDIYLVGQTYGYGITPTASNSGTYAVNNNSQSGFQATSNPFFFGATMTVTAGTLSTVGNAGSVGAQNIAVNVPNQQLGGFMTNFTGEPVTVQKMVFNVGTTSSPQSDMLTNVSIVDQNGNTIAGPVNQVGTTLTFSSSVTFPTGSMTYTLKGTVGSNAANGATYQISTDPYTDWTGAQGQISGSSVSLTDTVITMSTMTVQGPSLVISAASSPASTNVAAGANNFVIANINLDASQSGEDIRLASLPVTVVATDTTAFKADLTNCQLYNGSTALNSQSIGSSQWNVTAGTKLEANFVFQPNSLTVSKGTVVTLSLQCNISGSAPITENFSAGVSSGDFTATSATGVQSGNSFEPSLTSGSSVSGTMTIGSASLAATVPTALSFAQVAGGTTGVTVGSFTLQPTSDSVNLSKIALSLNSNVASSSDVIRAYIYNGSTQVGTVNFTGNPSNGMYIATTSITNLNLPQNVQTPLTIKADIAQIGAGQSGADGHKIVISLSNAQGTGSSSGVQVNSGTGTGTQTGVNIYRTFPTVAAGGSTSSTLLQGTQTLEQFTVAANSTGSVGLDQLGINVATSTASAANGTTTVTALNVYAYTDSGYSIAAPGTSSGLVGTLAGLLNSGTNIVTFTGGGTPVEIPAGSTYYFKVTATVTQVPGSSNTHGTIQTYLAGDSTNAAPSMNTVSGLNTSNFVWSPNATTTVGTTANDWTNGYGVSGLPSSGITPVTTLSN